jgi:hypothetical protein
MSHEFNQWVETFRRANKGILPSPLQVYEYLNASVVPENKSLMMRDHFASMAMLAVMQETQEMRIASFLDWLKLLLVTYLHFNFLTVRYIKVDNVYQDAAKRAYEYADAMMKESQEESCFSK